MKRIRHVVSTVPDLDRRRHRARCSCGWRGLPRTGPSSDVLAGNDGDGHLEHMAVVR